MSLRIRPAGPADAPALAALSTELGYPADAQALTARLAGVRAHDFGEVFVAEDEARGGVVGWTHVAPRRQLEEAPYAEIAGLIVADRARSAGVGAALLAAAEAWARGAGWARLRVRSNVVRERAHRFYERAGYVRHKSQAVFDKAL